MPTYEYECTKCGEVTEIMQSITAKPKRRPDEPCPGCGERAPIRRMISGGGAVLFKGSGFYETDYRSESYKKAAKADKEQAGGGKPDAKSDAKSDTKKPDATASKGKSDSGSSKSASNAA